MKNINYKKTLPLLALSFLLAGCTQTPLPSQTASTSTKLKIVASFYPLYELAQQIGKTQVSITNLIPAGVEPHDYEPTPQDTKNLLNADLVITNGAGLESWLEKIFPTDKSKVLTMADALSQDIQKPTEEFLKEEENASADPHIWLSPELYEQEAHVVAQKLITLDPTHEQYYEANLQTYDQQLENLQKNFHDGLANCQLHTIVTNHDAFEYLGKKYNFKVISISGISPEAEPSAQELAKLSDLVKQEKIQYIMTETLLSPKYAETIARETGAKTLELNPLEGLTDEEMTQGENYVTVMTKNLQTLKTALNCV